MNMAKVVKDKVDGDFEKHMHDGHRARMLSTVNEVGLDHLSSIQILEFILFYVFPRGDVNPLAHRLLARYETVSAALDAPVEDLIKIKGMGIASAKKFRSLLHIFDYYFLDKINQNSNMSNLGDFLDNVEILLRPKNTETCYIFGIYPSGEISHGRIFAKGDAEGVAFDATDISSYLATYKVRGLLFVHNHPSGTCFPSRQDKQMNAQIEDFAKYCGVKVYDSYIIGNDGIFSCKLNKLKRHFSQDFESLTQSEIHKLSQEKQE